MSVLQKTGHIKNIVVLISRGIQCLYLMYCSVAWVLSSSGTRVQPQIILDPDYIPDYLMTMVFYDHGKIYLHKKTGKEKSGNMRST